MSGAGAGFAALPPAFSTALKVARIYSRLFKSHRRIFQPSGAGVGMGLGFEM